jgi:hypothetical protein
VIFPDNGPALPGDLLQAESPIAVIIASPSQGSTPSNAVRAAFLRMNSVSDNEIICITVPL